MKRQRLTEAEERRLAEAIAAEARALGLTKKDKMPQETKRRLRARILKAILDERTYQQKAGSRPGCRTGAGRRLHLAAIAS